MNKILTNEELPGLIELLKTQNQKIVFTNGCFDILHPGHMDYLAQAKSHGDCLIIGLNSDDSVQRLKGQNRPFNDLNFRSLMLAALENVDFVIPFEEDTPFELIKRIMPDVLVKGGDYTIDNIVGAELVQEHGGKVLTIDIVHHYSSSNIIDKINKSGL